MRKHQRTGNLRRQDSGFLLTRRVQSSLLGCAPRTKKPRQSQRVSQRQKSDEAWLRRLHIHTDDIVILLGADGETRYQSPAAEQILGYAAKDTIGMNGFNFVHPDDRPHLLATFAALLDQPGSSCTATLRVLHNDGSWRTLEVVAINRLHDSAVAGIIIKCRKVVKPAEAEKPDEAPVPDAEWQQTALKQQREQQQQWVSDVTHELKSPLAAIRARLEIAALHPEHTNWQSLVSETLDEIALMRRLIDEIHDLAFIDEHGAMADMGLRSKVNVKALVVTEARRLPDHRVQTEPIATGWVQGNPDHVRRIVRNLLENAARYAHDTIRLSVATIQNRVVLCVEDDGPGIPVSDRERIFQRFRHVERDRGTNRPGPGLGLAIVRALVSQYRGEVTVGDSPLGGAKFIVTLPAAKE